MGHVNVTTLLKTAKTDAVIGLEGVEAMAGNFTCDICNLGKQPRQQHPPMEARATFPLEIIHSDVCGPMPVSSPSGSRYFVVFKDEYTGYRVVHTMRHKSEVPDFWKQYVAMAERQTGLKIKTIRSDNGLEYNNQQMKGFNQERDIRHEFSAPYTPQSNGRAEREIRTLVECARTMLIDSGLPEELWSEAIHCAAYVLNRTASKDKKTPFELWFKRKPNVSRIRIFGSIAFMTIPNVQKKKWDERSRKLILVGYDQESQNYRFWDIESRRIQIARDVVIRDGIMYTDAKKTNTYNFWLPHEEEIQKGVVDQAADRHSDHSKDSTSEEENNFQDCTSSTPIADISRRHTRSSGQHTEHYALDQRGRGTRVKYNERGTAQVVEKDDPDATALVAKVDRLYGLEESIDYEEALRSAEWRAAMEDEIRTLKKNDTWVLCILPKGEQAIPNKWIFKIKTTPDTDVVRYRARLVAGGHKQRQGIEYDQVFSPVARYDSIRILLAIAAQYNMQVVQFDIKCAYIYGDIDKIVYMKQPLGFVDKTRPDLVCRLQRSLYGCKQSGRCWNQKFVTVMEGLGFKQINPDTCVFTTNIDGIPVYLCLYVDDGLIMSSSDKAIKHVTDNLRAKFEIKEGPVNEFVGMQISQDRIKRTITVSQTNYIHRLLKRFGMSEAKPIGTPMDPGTQLIKPDKDKLEPHLPFKQAVGALLFAATVSRPDIAFAVGQVSRYMSRFDQSHWMSVKQIMRYLHGTSNYSLVYSAKGKELQVTGYTDADFAGCQDTRRSTTGFTFLINGTAVTWSSQRQSIVSLSSTESEYLALGTGVKDAIWVSNFLDELGYTCKPLPILIDNRSAIQLASNPEFHRRTKYLDVRHHFVRETVKRGIISITYIPTEENVSDIFTKNLTKARLSKLRAMLGVSNVPNIGASGGVEYGASNISDAIDSSM